MQVLLEEESKLPTQPTECDVNNKHAPTLSGVGEAGHTPPPLGQACPVVHDLKNPEGVKDGLESKLHVGNEYVGCSENKFYLPFAAAYAYAAAEGIIMDQDYDPDSDNSDSETEQPPYKSTQTLL